LETVDVYTNAAPWVRQLSKVELDEVKDLERRFRSDLSPQKGSVVAGDDGLHLVRLRANHNDRGVYALAQAADRSSHGGAYRGISLGIGDDGDCVTGVPAALEVGSEGGVGGGQVRDGRGQPLGPLLDRRQDGLGDSQVHNDENEEAEEAFASEDYGEEIRVLGTFEMPVMEQAHEIIVCVGGDGVVPVMQ
jgi:hypothetical protein